MDMSLQDLRMECKKNGLSAIGNKDTLVARLQEHSAQELKEESLESPDNAAPEDKAAMDLMQKSARVVDNEGKVKEATLILPTPNETARFTDRAYASEAENVLEKIKKRYPQLRVSIDTNQEVFIFEGGLQGRVTTTIHQPEQAILGTLSGVANTYVTSHQAAMAARGQVGEASAAFMRDVQFD